MKTDRLEFVVRAVKIGESSKVVQPLDLFETVISEIEMNEMLSIGDIDGSEESSDESQSFDGVRLRNED